MTRNDSSKGTSSPNQRARTAGIFADSPTESFGKNTIPNLDLPKGGGAFKAIDEKFSVNAVNGTCSLTVELPFSDARGFGTGISLNYNSGLGHSAFGLGWDISLPSVRRKTDKQLPRYEDGNDSDTFVLSGAEDLVPLLEENSPGNWQAKTRENDTYIIRDYRPRVEGGWTRIEQWLNKTTGVIHWRTISSDNITTFFGADENSRLADPKDTQQRVFEWKISHTFDDKGNIIVYRYKHEDFQGITRASFESGRDASNCTNSYLKRVLHGNRFHYRPENPLPDSEDFLFETVFDYGEHDDESPAPNDSGIWLARHDAFSSFRGGFDLRTYRLCRRVLLFHRFVELPVNPYLVTSLDLNYQDIPQHPGEESTLPLQGFSYLKSIQQHGHVYNELSESYTRQSLPAIYYSYQAHEWDTRVQKVSPDNLTGAPIGIDGEHYRWVDLYGEGLSGILSEKNGVLRYKRNSGSGVFSRAQPLSPQPSFAGVQSNTLQLQDLDGSGEQCLVNWETPAGYFCLEGDEQWNTFQAFKLVPPAKFLFDRNVRFIDLNGDGRADIMITEDNVFEWHESLGRDGYGPANRITLPLDEEQGPRIVFSDSEQTIVLSDMTGDGLRDIVRIRNGSICYWANRGYGQFSKKIVMANAPQFDNPENYNPDFLRTADLDGSGTTDLVYLGQNENSVKIWFNLNGNTWSAAPQTIDNFPAIDNLADVAVFDFLGSGTACLVWSSPLPGDTASPLRYIDLMASKKPHLLVKSDNNMGRESLYQYAPSTKFYLQDLNQGKPWATKLPFPVHVIESVTSLDHIRGTRFVSRYSYHHGHFDGQEREFRGFGRVEQSDTEEFSNFSLVSAANVVEEQHHQPPVRTISWFHTGAAGKNKQLLQDAFRKEYFSNGAIAEYSPPAPPMPADLEVQEWREAHRASKGILLRQEVYADDGSPQADYPYVTSESSFQIVMAQPRADNRHACFYIAPRESITHAYERNPTDPRISHTFSLEVDERGIVTKSVDVTYPRVNRPADLPDEVWEEQNKRHIVGGEVLLTDDIDTDDEYRLRSPYETISWELLGLPLPLGQRLTREDLLNFFSSASEIPYDDDGDGSEQLRVIAHNRRYFLANDLATELPLGQRESLALAHHAEQLAFTRGLITRHYGAKVDETMLSAAGYKHSEGDSDWWLPTGEALFPADAATRFYAAHGSRDVFGNENFISMDTYTLLLETTTNALGFTTSVENDYRTLSPRLHIDQNLNRTAVEKDALGQVIKTALMGKIGDSDGDTLADPTTRMEYELFNWVNHHKPNYIHSFAREQHGPGNPRWQESYAYSDGGGAVVMAKVQAEPGTANRWNESLGTVETVNTSNRWVGNGRVVVNNKGNPIKSFDPYFSATHEYETEAQLVETGISPVHYYDPMGRVIRSDLPNGTFTRHVFDPWHSQAFDANDTALESDWYSGLSSPDPDLDPEPSDPDQRAAWLTARHANTPTTVHSDGLGRTVYSVADHGNGKTTHMRNTTDLARRHSRVYDQHDREVSLGYTNLLGQTIYGESPEKGQRWLLNDVLGRLVRLWDNSNIEYRATFDALHRPLSAYMTQDGEEFLINHAVYGEHHPEAQERNLVGRGYQLYDQAGVIETARCDFKGNQLSISRRLCRDYQNIIDWLNLAGLSDIGAITTAAEPQLEAETFTGSSSYDALNRPIESTLADGTVLRPTYNEANYLDSLSSQIMGQGSFKTFLQDQDYDARGRRQQVTLGNGNVTRYFYDAKTFRLSNLITTRTASDTPANRMRDIHYHYDPVGNITSTIDNAQQTHYFSNVVVKPENHFEYDAIYQLTKATGREHAGLGANTQRNHQDLPYQVGIPHSNDATAVRQYTQTYHYDDLGNIKQFRHQSSGSTGNWTRHYRYQYETSPGDRTNRLAESSVPGEVATDSYSNQYSYDTHGNMTGMPHLAALEWDYADRLRAVDLGGGGWAFYVYGGAGRRRRKVIERNGGQTIDRIYLGATEIYRVRNAAGDISYERWTVHIADTHGRIAQVDTKTIDVGNTDPVNPLNTPLTRYQMPNHQGSATIETDDSGDVISLEEYHPFGTTAYRLSSSATDLSLKRYRYCGKERDHENGLDYCGARYYASWLGRWTSSDPAGFADGANLYRYCSNSPVVFHDPNGTDGRVARNAENAHLADPAQRAAAETYLEGVYTARMRRSGRIAANQKIDITAMHFEGESGSGMWQITAAEIIQSDSSGTATVDGPGSAGGDPNATGDGSEADSGEGNADSSGDGDASVNGSSGATGAGEQAIHRNPGGFELEVPDNFDDGKIDAYRERIRTDRGVGNRSAVPGERRRANGSDVTDQIRHDNRQLVTDFDNANGNLRSRQLNVDHSVELQHIIRGNETGGADTVRPQDHRYQAAGENSSQGSSARAVRDRAVNAGAPEDAPAGAVSRSSNMGGLRNRPWVRGTLRGLGHGMMVAGPGLTAWGASQVENDAVRYGAYGSAAVEAGGVARYMQGRYALGGANGMNAGRAAMSVGGRVAMGAGGVGQALLSGYMAYEDYQRGDWVAFGFDAAAAVGGVALVAAAIVSAPAVAVGLAVFGIATGIAAGVFHLGRAFDWW